MLYIYISGKLLITWHVGKSPPSIAHLSTEKHFEIQADDDELDYIYRHFKNIPKAKHKRVVIWHGDIAKFIAKNL